MKRSVMGWTVAAFLLVCLAAGVSAWPAERKPDPAAAAQVPAAARGETLVTGATIWTVSDAGTFEKGDLLVRDGKIVAVASSLEAPRGALVVHAEGRHVTPGLIDAHSHTAVAGSVNEGSNNITSEVRIGDVLDSDDISIYRELAGGLTAANILHGSANSIGGQNQVIKLKWGAEAQQLKFRGARAGIKFALGENPKRSNFQPPAGTPQRYPATRMGVEESIRERFQTARQYEKDWDDYNALKPKEQARRVPPRRDLQVEAIEQVLRHERLVHSHSYRQDEILMLIRLAEEFGFKVATFQHVLEGYKVADEIARHGAGASTFSDWWAYKLEAHDAIPFNGSLMAERGIVVSFNSDSDELARRLNLEAAKAIKYGGMSEEEAIKLVTLNPAKQLGIERRVGSLEPGKDADFVLWSGHPFSVYTVAEQTWVDGVKEFDRARDLAGRAAIEERRAALIEKVKRGDKPAPAMPPAADKSAAPPAPAAVTASRGMGAPAGAPKPEWRDRLAATSGTTAISGATIHPVSGKEIQNGTVVMRNGNIVAVGREVDIPTDATLVKADGLHLYPGMIDPSTVVGLTEIGSVAGSIDTAEAGKINPNVHVEIAVNPESDLIPVTRANGITHVLTAPRGGLIAGTSALIRLAGWTWEDLTAAAPLAMHVNFPAYPSSRPGRGFGPAESLEDQKKRMETDLREMKQTLEAARAWQQASSAGSAAVKPDPVLGALVPVLEGRIPVIVAASEVRQIRDAIAWARAEGLKMILETSADVWRVTDLLKENDIPVIVGPILSDNFRRDEPYDTAYAMPARLHEAGVRFCIMSSGSSFGAPNTRNLPYHAGMAAAFGLPRDVALKSVTLYPAQILGVGDRLGSIEVGKSGSLILTDGDPLEIRTRVLREWIDGREVDLGNRHQRLYDKYRGRPTPPPPASVSPTR